MADTVVSDARMFPQDEGLPNISDGSESWNSAGWQALLAMAKDSSGSYARSDSELTFTNHDATNDVVDATAGVAYLDMAGETVDVQSQYGGSDAPAYDLALPTLPLIAVTLPTPVADIPLQDATLSSVWLAYATDGSVTGIDTGDVYIRSDDTGSVAAPPHPNVKLGEANPDDAAADALGPRYGSSEFEAVTVDRLTTVSSTQEPSIDSAGQWWIRADEPGTSVWSHSLHSSTVQSVFERDGVVYSGSNDDTVKAADASDGTEIWSHSLHSGYVVSVYERDGVIYSGSLDNTVKAADASDGTEIWSHSLHSDTVQSVFERDGVVYSGSNDNTVKAADASDGTEIWSHSLHSDAVRSVFERDGVIYSGSFDNTVKAADASDGTEIWSHSLHSDRVYPVYERDGVIYSGSLDNTVKAADASDGTEIWSHSLHSDRVYSVYERDGVVYSGSNDNTVKAAVSMPASYVAAPDLSGGELDWQLNSKLHSDLDRR